MKRPPVWKVSVVTTAEAEEAVSEMLTRFFGLPASTHNDLENGRTTVSVFFESEPTNLKQVRREWKQAIAGLKAFGLDAGPAWLRMQKLPGENWAESWKRHFKPLEIGNALLVKPSWIKQKAKSGQATMILDPGLSFGTGQHPTTSFCLRELVRHRRSGERQAFLDIGTGSGILAIAAAKLGYAPVHAFDFDPESVRVANENARRNRVGSMLTIARRDLTKTPPTRRYDLVCANLISTLLLAERKRIAAFVNPGGTLVVAGILAKEFAGVQNAFGLLGFHLVAQKREKEWKSGAFIYSMRVGTSR
jgi:ribosomal protein L11 methyltransferase